MKQSVLKTILWSLIVGLLIVLGWLAFQYPAQITKSIAYSPPVVTRRIETVPQTPVIQFGTLSQSTTVLFMGTDVVYSHSKHQHKADPGSCQGNSDTMMLVFLNPHHNTISVLHIPRDTEANLGKWGIQKINLANPIGGPELAKATVSSLLDVSIDHYAIMNVQGLVELVNELGGITVEVPKKMNYMDWTGKLKIDLEPGFHTLTGNQAMGFVRFRHDALGDIGRIQRQQIFLQAVIRKMLNPLSWLHLNTLMEIAQRNIRTDMSNIELFEALNFVHSVPHENIKFVMLPGDFASNGDWIANTEGKTIAEHLADPDQESITSRRNITVCIINASSDRALGHKLSKALRKLGYITCVAKDEIEPAANKTRIIAQNGNIANANMMQQDLGNAGEVVNASVGDLLNSITIVAHDDINLDKITMSSADAPYMVRSLRQPLVIKPSPISNNKQQTETKESISDDDSQTSSVQSESQNDMEAESHTDGQN